MHAGTARFCTGGQTVGYRFGAESGLNRLAVGRRCEGIVLRRLGAQCLADAGDHLIQRAAPVIAAIAQVIALTPVVAFAFARIAEIREIVYFRVGNRKRQTEAEFVPVGTAKQTLQFEFQDDDLAYSARNPIELANLAVTAQQQFPFPLGWGEIERCVEQLHPLHAHFPQPIKFGQPRTRQRGDIGGRQLIGIGDGGTHKEHYKNI